MMSEKNGSSTASSAAMASIQRATCSSCKRFLGNRTEKCPLTSANPKYSSSAAKHLQHRTDSPRNKGKMAIKDSEFEGVVREHEAMLYRIAFNFFLSTPVAEEIVQDVFLQCFQKRKSIQSQEHL